MSEHLTRRTLSAIAIVYIACFNIAAAQERTEPASLGFESLIPPDTALLVKCSGIDALKAESASLSLSKLFHDPEVQAFLAEALDMIPDLLDDGEDAPYPLPELWSLCRGEIAFAWCRNGPFISEKSVPHAAVAVEMGSDREAFKKQLNSLIDVTAWARNMEQGTERYRGIEISSLGWRNSAVNIFHACIRNHFVASLSLDFMKEIADTHLDNKPSLARYPAFCRCTGHAAGKGVDLLAFTGVKSCLKIFGPMCPPGLEEWMSMLGLDNVNALCFASTLERGGSNDSLYLDHPGEKTGLFTALSPAPLSGNAFAKAQPEALLFAGVSFDHARIVSELGSFLEKFFPEKHAAYQGWMDAFADQTGLNLEQDILSPLGNEATLTVSMPAMAGMAMIPDIIISISLDEEEWFPTALDKLFAALEAAGEDVGDTSFSGRTLRHISPPQSEIPVSITFVVEDGRLLIASTTLTMKRYLRWLDKGEPGIVDNEAFTQAMTGLPFDASMVAFADLKRSLQIGYGMGAPFLPMVLANSDLPLEAGLLPMAETLSSHMSNAVVYAVMDEEGLLVSSRCPMGAGALCALSASIMDYIMEKNLFHGFVAELTGSIDQVSRQTIGPQRMAPDLEAAFRLINEGEYGLANARLTAWIEANPETGRPQAWAYRNRGDCRFKIERFEQAAADYEKVAELDSGLRSLCYYNMARAYALANEVDKGFSWLEKAVSAGHKLFYDDPDLGNLKNDLRFAAFSGFVMPASRLVVEGKHGETLEFFTGWIQSNPQHGLMAWALKTRGNTFKELDRYDEAVADYEKAAEMNDSFKPSVYYTIACLASVRNEKERAIELLKKSLDSGFDDIDMIDYDSDLDNIRNETRFKALRWR